ncbi:MAG: TonB family protein [Desulfuromonadaceae bacterium]|nr:TonB family protein [Desulfuromonadaceae bacterium]
MTAKNLWKQCVIGSLIFHIGLLVLMKNVSPSPLVAMRAVDAFIVESFEVKTPEPTRSFPPDSHKNVSSPIQEMSRLQPAHRETLSASLHTDRNAEVKMAPSKDIPDAAVSSPVQITTSPTTMASSAAVALLPARAEEDTAGNKASGASFQTQATNQVMMLGDVGAARFIHRELPVYPFLARKLGKEGKVLLRLALDEKGKLQGIDTVETSGYGFADAASRAIRKSTFEPATSNGVAVSSMVLVPIRFVLN